MNKRWLIISLIWFVNGLIIGSGVPLFGSIVVACLSMFLAFVEKDSVDNKVFYPLLFISGFCLILAIIILGLECYINIR